MFLSPRHACCVRCRTRRPIRPLLPRPSRSPFPPHLSRFSRFWPTAFIFHSRIVIVLEYNIFPPAQYLSSRPTFSHFHPLYAYARSVPRRSRRRTFPPRQRKKGLSPLIRSVIDPALLRCNFYQLPYWHTLCRPRNKEIQYLHIESSHRHHLYSRIFLLLC